MWFFYSQSPTVDPSVKINRLAGDIHGSDLYIKYFCALAVDSLDSSWVSQTI